MIGPLPLGKTRIRLRRVGEGASAPAIEKEVEVLHDRDFAVAIETNGTIVPPSGIDWVCVSPKAGAELLVRSGDELKIVVPQAGLDPLVFAKLDFRRFSVQPMDGPERASNTELAVAFCLKHPRWQLSLQTHKMTGIR